MKRLKGLPEGRTLTIPVMGTADYNSGFLVAIGQLVVSWANNESVFLAMLQALMPDTGKSAAIVWYAQRTSQARLELLSKLIRERVRSAGLIADIEAAIRAFKGPTRTRNFYCHATYLYDREMRLAAARGVTLSQDGVPLRQTERTMDLAMANEVGNAIVELAVLNRQLWNLVDRLCDELGVQRAERQQLPPEYLPP